MEDGTPKGGKASPAVNQRDRRLMIDAVAAIHRVGVEKATEISGLPKSTIMAYKAGKRPRYLYDRTRQSLRAILRFSPKPKPEPPPKPEPKSLTADDYLASRAMRKKEAEEPEPEIEIAEPVTIDPLMKMVQRIVDALEVSAVALTIIAESLDE
jgi:chromatin segregation and condensation protein Rec8/ScpA/Scc1 (kleisin family)